MKIAYDEKAYNSQEYINLTSIIILTKKIHLLKNNFERMIVEMLLNNDMQKTIWWNDLTISNGNTCNCVDY